MIHEDDLRRLLNEAAESVPPPGRAPEELLADLTAPSVAPTRRRPPRLKLAAAAAAVVTVVALGATLAVDDTSRDTQTAADQPQSATTVPDAGGRSDDCEGCSVVPNSPLVPSSPASESPAAGQATDGTANPATPPVGQPADTAKVIKTGSLDLEVRKGAFDGTVDRITAQTIGLGGYITESTTSESSDFPSGTIIVRVPEDSFETLLADVRKLGEVKAVTSKGTDVTAQFTDLEARLSALRATRDRLSTVLGEADNVPDILAVQDRITDVQVQIEQIQGQQRVLEDQTAFGTLAITLGEPGAEAIEIDSTPDEGLGKAWDDARRRFGDSIEDLVSWSGSAAVVLLVGVFLLALSRVAWVGLRRRMV